MENKNTIFTTLELILYWGKLTPSDTILRVRSLVTNHTYNMSLTGFLYYVKENEIPGEWIIL